MSDAEVIIGIDLGTTNCTLAYMPIGDDKPTPTQFAIEQVTAIGTQDAQSSLPSFIYFPLEEEISKQVAGIDWDPTRAHCIGVHARERGLEVPDRVVASAKSWLCHDGVNRREKLLPLSSEDETGKTSPLEACTLLLTHLREAWEQKMTDLPFAEQKVLVTVPASFTPSARQLVQEAAEDAAYPEIVLLEEPQAAFYAWLQVNAENWRDKLEVGDKVLVVDIGGGTTDFSLISASDNDGDLELTRLAVGSHLLLGGDNMDLALAYRVKMKIEEKGPELDDWQMHQLVHSCRAAKETLMGENPPEHVDIAIQGRGSGLVGGTITAVLTESEVHETLVDGFFPLLQTEEQAASEEHLGLQELGLPYAQDARITAQLARFLAIASDEDFTLPTAVLFNGGTMKAHALKERVVEQLQQWAEEKEAQDIRVLDDADLDYAVSRGAAYYGLARSGKAIRIKGGTSHSYYVGVEEATLAIPGMPPSLRAICVAPFGMEEGTEAELPNREFCLVLGEPATFRFFSCNAPKLSDGTEASVGTEIRKWKTELTELHPIETNLERGESDGKTVRVNLRSHVTELGVLELWCHSQDGRKWKLEFDIRQDAEAFAEV